MKETYSYRRYQPGDEVAINDLYFKITGRQRSLAQYKWQWLDAPEGVGEIWLIEATDEYENTKLIGHHGIMPIAFTNKDTELLFGKTENTMVLPEYRKKILYPRFEQKFMKVYAERFDALFSTMGPKAAIKQRKAMGYEYPVSWVCKKYRTSIISELYFLLFALKSKFIGVEMNEEVEKPYGLKLPSYQRLAALGFISDEEMKSSNFFNDYWSLAKHNYNVAPRREYKDLKWRYWSNPYKEHLTMIIDEVGFKGYAILSFEKNNDSAVFLEDFSSRSNTEEDNLKLFNKLIDFLNRASIRWMTINQSSDSSLVNTLSKARCGELVSWKAAHNITYKNTDKPLMARKITKKGEGNNVDITDWDATAFVFEGRL